MQGFLAWRRGRGHQLPLGPLPQYKLLPPGLCCIFKSGMSLALIQGSRKSFCPQGTETQFLTPAGVGLCRQGPAPALLEERLLISAESCLHPGGDLEVLGVSVSSGNRGHGTGKLALCGGGNNVFWSRQWFTLSLPEMAL